MPTINMFDASKYGLESTAMLSGDVAVQQSNAGTAADSLGVPHRLYQLLTKLEKLLSEKYAFDVFAKDSINFGIMVTYRQTWKPENYQVGDLISTLPLSPKEVRRFTSRMVSKKTRAVKELEDSLITRREESSDTSRIDAEIVDKAQNKSNFTITANETINAEAYTINSTQSATLDQVKDSAKTKKEFHESVLKSAQEYKQQHRMEIDTSENQENENTTFHEIQNPNDELAVTYLFYELQRTYRLNEKIHKLTPVILVANDVPAPNEIDDAWLVKHDWMLRRVILDDSFRPALEYLTKSFVGAEVNIRILENNAQLQKNIVDKLNQQIQLQTAILAMSQGDVENATRILAVSEVGEATINNIKRMLDPIGITGETDTGTQDAAQTMLDYAKETANRAEREKARLLSQLEVAMTALQAAVNQLSKAVKEHYDKIAEIDRLRVHVKDNILHYMQAIWSFEPPDQRFFRLAQKIEVPVIEEEGTNLDVDVYSLGSTFEEFVQEYKGFSVELPVPKIKVTKKKLVEVANLDNLLGYKGNYMIFPLKENNFITLHMMQNYLEV
ncbi:MAG TPA: hypothetical protein DCX54_03485, partial [Flavobacteriales bacterium]|nr:hypothetical protein [Flavobacteriales bacterium]